MNMLHAKKTHTMEKSMKVLFFPCALVFSVYEAEMALKSEMNHFSIG